MNLTPEEQIKIITEQLEKELAPFLVQQIIERILAKESPKSMIITAKYDGKCRDCGSRIRAGQQVSWEPSRKRTTCLVCYGRPPAIEISSAPAVFAQEVGHEPLMNEELYTCTIDTVYDQRKDIKITPLGMRMLQSYGQAVVDDKVDRCIAMGALAGCQVCLEGKADPDHLVSKEHMVAALYMPSAVLSYGYNMLENLKPSSQAPVLPKDTVDGSNTLAIPCWRGYTLEENDLMLRGMNSFIWRTRSLVATCHGSRELCLEHLAGPELQEPEYNLRFSSHYGLVIRDINTRSAYECDCGIYAVDQVARLKRTYAAAEVYAECLAWGHVYTHTEGLRASDVTIKKLWLRKDMISKQMTPFQTRFFNWKDLEQALISTYGVPVVAISDAEFYEEQETKSWWDNFARGMIETKAEMMKDDE